jgi:PAS domain S-box-containing protein
MNDSGKKKNALLDMVKTITKTSSASKEHQIDLEYLEKELKKSADRFEAILTYSNDAIFIIDPETQMVIDVNERACRMLGFPREKCLTMTTADIFSDLDHSFQEFSRSVFEEGEGWSNELLCKTRTGDLIPTEITAWTVAIGDKIFLLSFVHDISQRKRTEEALRESEQKFRTLIENMQEGVMIVDNDDVIQFVNNRICKMLGYREKELLGQVGYKLLFRKQDQKTIREKNRLRTKMVSDQYEIQMVKENGEPIWMQISGVPIKDSQNAVTGSFGIIADIHSRKLAEQALRRAHGELEQRVEERTAELLKSNESLQREINERIQLEEERQKFISLVENSNDVITMATPDGKLIYINECGIKTLGLQNPGEALSKHLVEYHPPEYEDFVKNDVIPAIIQEGSWKGELPLRNFQTGELTPTLFNGFIVRHTQSDEIIALATICRDITDRKKVEEALQKAKDGLEMRVEERTAELSEANQSLIQQILERQRAEEQLQESEKKYRILFNSGNDAIFVYHPLENGEITNFIEVNDVACHKLGYERGELLKLSNRSLSLGYNEDEAAFRTRRLLGEKHILYEDMFLTKTGGTIPVEISAHLFEFNEKPTVMSIARDITARKRAEEQIREQAALLDKAQDAILVCDLNDYIIYWNNSAERMYGWKTEEAIGNNAFELLFNRDSTQFIASRRAVLENGEWQGELHQVTKEGKEIMVESRWTLVHDNGGEAKSILVVNTDISEKKKIEAQFLRAQRMESIGALAGGIAHDLNNVLAPILTAVQILQLRISDEKSQRILTTIESNVKRGADMVKQILTFARGVEGERVPLQLHHLIYELEKIILETFPKSIKISLDLPSNLWTVSGDATQLHQVLLNLCVNARDAMPKGGKLTISAENTVVDEEFARVNLDAKTGDHILIKVNDTGVGIPSNIINKIFEPFFSTKEPGKGTGLGLSTVLAIVKSHGGFVTVSSEVSRGTTFEIYLPALVEMGMEEAKKIETDLMYGNGELILVVDDETSILEITRETLETYGYKVMAAHDGAEAIAIYARHKDSIQVVITDMMMPVMDGAATIRALRRINPQVKIIASSGFMEDAKIAEFVGDGIEAFLHKPYTADKLLDVIHQNLHKDSD